jgi:hypothetical protein
MPPQYRAVSKLGHANLRKFNIIKTIFSLRSFSGSAYSLKYKHMTEVDHDGVLLLKV